jgi:hypothetical protein
LPSPFQNSHGSPSTITGLASIDPPSSRWQMNGYPRLSTYGPFAEPEVATPMHWSPDSRSLLV